MEAASTSVSTFQAITAVLATMASCWLTMATTAWVRSVFMDLASGDADVTLQLHPWEMCEGICWAKSAQLEKNVSFGLRNSRY